MDDHGCVREMPESARVVHVQVRLHDMSDRGGVGADAFQLSDAVVVLGHVNLEHVRERAEVRAGISRDRQRIAAVDDDVPLRVAEQEERDRHLEAGEHQRAAGEQLELEAVGHRAILRLRVDPGRSPTMSGQCLNQAFRRAPASSSRASAGSTSVTRRSATPAHRRCCS
jgi:hypothetical protein